MHPLPKERTIIGPVNHEVKGECGISELRTLIRLKTQLPNVIPPDEGMAI